MTTRAMEAAIVAADAIFADVSGMPTMLGEILRVADEGERAGIAMAAVALAAGALRAEARERTDGTPGPAAVYIASARAHIAGDAA